MSSFKQTVSYCNQNTDIFIAYIFTGVSVFAGGPEFIGNLQNVTVPEGRDATFTCSVTNLGGHKVDNFKKSSWDLGPNIRASKFHEIFLIHIYLFFSG